VRQKILPIILPSDAYARLERQARANERDTLQQARWLLKEALRREAPIDRSTETPAPAGAGT
jgi:hypothetical protein